MRCGSHPLLDVAEGCLALGRFRLGQLYLPIICVGHFLSVEELLPNAHQLILVAFAATLQSCKDCGGF